MLSDEYRNQVQNNQQQPPILPPQMPSTPGNPPLKPGQIEHFFGWKVTAVPKEGHELLDATQDPFFQQYAQQVCDHLAIAQLQGMNSVTMDDHQFAITVLELPIKEGENIPLPPERAIMFVRPIVHQLVDGMVEGTIRLVEDAPNPSVPPIQIDLTKYGLAGWSVPEE